ncbi:unnamed protein product [Adineta ricciae]|uniref:Uncharacterized protein n=1 Tax=Adineta ricciae TaxID=249248 RepID=A0A815J9B5_ADIRI|nr:unnamed protein product [Adineta ricciae]
METVHISLSTRILTLTYYIISSTFCFSAFTRLEAEKHTHTEHCICEQTTLTNYHAAKLFYFVSHQNPQLLQTQQGRRAQRDYIIMRRILFTMIVLLLAGIPNVGLAFLAQFKPNLSGDYYMYRIEWMVPSVSMLTVSIGLVFITPQLKTVVVSCLQRKNQVVPQDNTRF